MDALPSTKFRHEFAGSGADAGRLRARAGPRRERPPARRSTATASREPAATSRSAVTTSTEARNARAPRGWATAYVGIIPPGTATAATIAPQAPSQLPTMLLRWASEVAAPDRDDTEGHGHERDDREHVQPAEGTLVDVPDPERRDRRSRGSAPPTPDRAAGGGGRPEVDARPGGRRARRSVRAPMSPAAGSYA